MKIKIEIKTKGKEQLNPDIIHDLNEVLEEHNFKNISIKESRICDGCERIMPKDYPNELDLCPNCEDGKRQAMEGSI